MFYEFMVWSVELLLFQFLFTLYELLYLPLLRLSFSWNLKISIYFKLAALHNIHSLSRLSLREQELVLAHDHILGAQRKSAQIC